MRALWRVHPADPEASRGFACALGVHPLTAQVLLNRGVRHPDAARRFFSPRMEEADEPEVLPDMALAVVRIRRAIAAREPVLVFGDSDVDGVSASLIVEETLSALGGVVQVQLSRRLADGYGLPQATVRHLARSAVKLLVMVDCGTNQLDAVRALAAHGLDTVIVDHHVPQAAEPAGDGEGRPCALINPRCGGEARGRELCSAGLALKLAQALLGRGAARWRELLDVAALGTLADYSPMTGDNRAIVAEGVPQIVDSPRPGLRRLCEEMRVGRGSADQVLRRLVPRLNACGRLGDASAAWKVLRRDPGGELDEWLGQTRRAHEQTRRLHREVIADATEQVNRLHFRDQAVVIVSRQGWPQGLMGPLAAQLSQRYARPAIAVAMGETEGVGSGRSVPQVNLLSALTACAPWLLKFGGHAQACGVTIRREQFPQFQDAVNQHVRRLLGSQGWSRTITADCEAELGEVTPAWVKELERFAPFGIGNPRPSVLLRGVRVETSAREGTRLSDGSHRLRTRGTLVSALGPDQIDVIASPSCVGGDVTLTVQDAKGSAVP